MSYRHLQEVLAPKEECEALSKLFAGHYRLKVGPKISRIRRFDRASGELCEYDTFFEVGSGGRAMIREFLESGATVYCQLGSKKFINGPQKSAYCKAEEEVARMYGDIN